MRVLLVRPARIKQSIALGEFMYSEPIGLEMVFAMLEKDHQVEILDLMAENIKIEDSPCKILHLIKAFNILSILSILFLLESYVN